MKRGEIYYIDLSDDDLVGCEQGGSIRPCVVIQNNVGNKYSKTVIIAMISSQLNKNKLPTHVDIPSRSYLEKDSVIFAEQIRTVDRQRVKHKIARLTKEEIIKLNKALAISIGIQDGEIID